MTNILLLGCGGNAGINFVKSLRLSANSYTVIGLDTDHYKLSASNVDHKYLCPKENAKKIELITKLIIKHNIRAIHAQPDQEVEWLLLNKNNFSNLVFDHNYEKKRIFDNKQLTAKNWNVYLKLNFESFSLTDCIKDHLCFERIIKKTGKAWIRARQGAGSKGALPIATLKQAIAWAEYWQEFKGVPVDQFMISEYLPGPEYAVQYFFIQGQEIHSQMRQRLVPFFQNQMPSGQSSTPAVAKTTYKKEVYDTAYAAIKQFDHYPHGLYSVDLKTSYQDKIVPIEVNYGRFFTTSDFFASLGINTPDAYIQYLVNKTIDYRIKSIKDEIYWLRGLDHNPVLKAAKEIECLKSSSSDSTTLPSSTKHSKGSTN